MNRRFLLLAAALPFALLAAEPAMQQTDSTPPSDMPPSSMPPADTPPSDMASSHVMYDAAQLKWGDAPPSLPKGAQAAVLSGDPGQAGPFVLRIKVPAGYKVPLHWHPTDEMVTVIEGDFSLQMGDGASRHAHTFGPAGYVLLPAHMQHAANTQGGAIVQVASTGPFQINYVDPKDDPRTQMPAAPKAGH